MIESSSIVIDATAPRPAEAARDDPMVGVPILERRRWHDHLGVLLGLWVVLSPIAFRFTHDTVAAHNADISGLLVATVASGVMRLPLPTEKMLLVVFGVWLVAAPRVLGFDAHFEEAFSTIINGVAIAAAAAGAVAGPRVLVSQVSAWIAPIRRDTKKPESP